MSYPVKWFLDSMGGAPRCSGTAGDLVTLLDACLINGFNLLAVQSIAVTSGIATATFASAPGYLADQIVLIAGATPDALNGEKRVISVVSNTITFAAAGVADGTATGTISCRTAPVGGWEKVYSDTNKGVYRSTDITGTRLYLRVDDTNATYALARGYEAMSDVDTGLGPFPTVAQATSGKYWKKSQNADTSARTWWLAGDGKTVSIGVLWSTQYPAYEYYGYGDFYSILPGDAYNCFVIGGSSAPSGWPGSSFATTDNSTCAGHIARAYTQSVGAITYTKTGNMANSGFGRSDSNPAITYPSLADGGLPMARDVLLIEGGVVIRGKLRGILQPLARHSSSPTSGTVLTVGTDKILIVSISTGGGSGGRIGFDLETWD